MDLQRVSSGLGTEQKSLKRYGSNSSVALQA